MDKSINWSIWVQWEMEFAVVTSNDTKNSFAIRMIGYPWFFEAMIEATKVKQLVSLDYSVLLGYDKKYG